MSTKKPSPVEQPSGSSILEQLLLNGAVKLLPPVLYSLTPPFQPTYIDDEQAKKMTLPEKCLKLSEVKQMKRYADMQFSKMAPASYPSYKFSQTVFRETFVQAADQAEKMLNGWANEDDHAIPMADGVTVERDGIVVTPSRPSDFFGLGHIIQNIYNILGVASAPIEPPQAQSLAHTYGIAYDVVHTETQLLAITSGGATQAEWDAAPRVPFDSKKREFIQKLKTERNHLAARLKSKQREEFNYSSNIAFELQRNEEVLLTRMDRMLSQVDQVAFYEVQSPPANRIPATYVSEGPQKGIHFARGIYTFQLAFHEMSHRIQMENPERTHSFWSNSAHKDISFNVSDRDDKTYLACEEEVYQWGVQFVLSRLGDLPEKMANAVDELKGIQDTVAQMREMAVNGKDKRPAVSSWDGPNRADKQLESVCNLIQGKHPQIYDVADQLFKAIEALPDLTREEKNSLILLTAAYYGIRFERSGQLVYDKTAMQTLLENFYSKLLHQH